MKINCIHCGHAFGVDASYCDYQGLLRCATCGGLLDVAIQDGMIRGVRPGSLAPAAPPTPAETPAPESEPARQPVPAPTPDAPAVHDGSERDAA